MNGVRGTTSPWLFKVRSGVSKNTTWRICDSSGSIPSAVIVCLLSPSGTVSLSSTVSAFAINFIISDS